MLVLVLAPLAFALGFAVGARWTVGVAASAAVGVLAGASMELAGLPEWFVGMIAFASTAAGFAIGAVVRRGQRMMPHRRPTPRGDQRGRRTVTPATAEEPEYEPVEAGRPGR